MMVVFFQGRGWFAPILLAIAMFLPLIVLRQIDGPVVDKGEAITLTAAALLLGWLGVRWNRSAPQAQPAAHSFLGIPVQYWAIPMLGFALCLATGVITTAEDGKVNWGTTPLINGTER